MNDRRDEGSLYARGAVFSCGKIGGVTSPPTEPAGTQHAGIRDAKRAVRDRVLAARDGLAAETRHAASVAIAATLEARPDFRAARGHCVTRTCCGPSAADIQPGRGTDRDVDRNADRRRLDPAV